MTITKHGSGPRMRKPGHVFSVDGNYAHSFKGTLMRAWDEREYQRRLGWNPPLEGWTQSDVMIVTGRCYAYSSIILHATGERSDDRARRVIESM